MTNNMFNKKIIIGLMVFAMLFSSIPTPALAVWDGNHYAPGATDNPECLPTDTNCNVQVAITAISLGGPSGSNANGGSIASNVLTLSFADATNPGLVSTGAQTFVGDKTFTNALTVNGTTSLTSLTASGLTSLNSLTTSGNTTLGDAFSDVLTINGATVSVPNNLNFDSNTLFIDALNNNVGIGTITPIGPFEVAENGNRLLRVTPTGTVTAGYVSETTEPYYITSAIPYAPMSLDDVSGYPLFGDNGMMPVDLPFPFTFFGNTYSGHQASQSTNGFLMFVNEWWDGSVCNGGCEYPTDVLPYPGNPNNMIAGYWNDMLEDAPGVFKRKMFGEAPNRVFVFEYKNVKILGTDTEDGGYLPATFQIRLFEGSNNIEIHTESIPDPGFIFRNAFQGIENANGTRAYYLDSTRAGGEVFSLTNDAVRFTYFPGTPLELGAGSFAVQNNAYVNGNVGIGEMRPQRKLDVAGGLVVDGNLLTQIEGGLSFGGVGVSQNQWNIGNIGAYWTARGTNLNPAPNNSWKDVSMSADGKYQVAVVNGLSGDRYIYTSSDYGSFWNTEGSLRDWRDAAISSDGKYMTAVANDAAWIRSSFDYGETWSYRVESSALNWNAVAMSSDGKYQAATADGTNAVHISSDYGVFFTAGASTGAWSDIAMSSDGKYMAAIKDGIVHTSSDYGSTWINTTRTGSKLAMSANGKLVTTMLTGGQIYTSSNYGFNWTARDANRQWSSIAMTANGQYQTAAVSGGQIYISSDYGATWTAMESNRDWRGIAMSSDGKYITASVNGGQIYTSYAASYTNGNVGIGTTTPALRFHVSNTGQSGPVARFTDDNGYCDIDPTSTALVCSSDKTLKKNVVTIDSTLEKMLALNSVEFNWQKEDDGSAKHFGLIAQEVEAIFPSLVKTDENGFKSVAYGNFTPLLIKVAQEQYGGMMGVNIASLPKDENGVVMTDGLFSSTSTLNVLAKADSSTDFIADPIDYIRERVGQGIKIVRKLVAERFVAIEGYFNRIFARQYCGAADDGEVYCITGNDIKRLGGAMLDNASGIPSVQSNQVDSAGATNDSYLSTDGDMSGNDIANTPSADSITESESDSELGEAGGGEEGIHSEEEVISDNLNIEVTDNNTATSSPAQSDAANTEPLELLDSQDSLDVEDQPTVIEPDEPLQLDSPLSESADAIEADNESE